MILPLAVLLTHAAAPVPYTALQPSAPAQARATASASSAPGDKPEPVISPVWLSGPNQSLIQNCMQGYLKDPTFTGEAIVMACTVQRDGSIDQCLVQESKRAQAAGVHDVAVCASAGFRMGPIDKLGKPVAGRPIFIPMGVTPLANVANAPTRSPTDAASVTAPTPAKKP